MKSVFEYQLATAAKMINAKGVPAIRIPYTSALSNPHEIAKRIKEFLALDQLDVDEMATAVDPKLYRTRVSKNPS